MAISAIPGISNNNGVSNGTGVSLPGGVSYSASNTIGGLAIGSLGTGFRSGYTLAGGDDFNGALNIVNVNNPNGTYFPTIAYEAGARGTTGNLTTQYDSDAYNTGIQDANRGVPLGSNVLTQSNSILNMNARIQNANETGKIGNGRTLITSMIHTGGYLSSYPPCMMECYLKMPSGTYPSGSHFTFWLLSANPVSSTGSPGALEFDIEANSIGGNAPTTLANNIVVHQTVAGWTGSVNNGTSESIFDGQWHTLTFELTTSFLKIYLDGILHATTSGDTTAPGLPYYLLITNHVTNPQNIADWNTLSVPVQVDYYRIWLANASYPSKVITPLRNLPTLQVNYNTSMTYTFPSLASLWGAGYAGTDYCQGIKFEDFEPGSSTAFTGDYTQFPAGLSFNSGTRVLTGITTDKQPGRIHTSAMPNLSGGSLGYAARGYIDVGPNITTTTLNASQGVPFSYDLYPDCNCGNLVPKVITCTGLPSGLSFSPSTGLITGTPTTSGTTAITIGVTNASGQTATATPNIIVAAPATSYTLTGPLTGAVNVASTAFRVTPNGPYTGTITPASTVAGTFSPSSLTFSNSSATQTFTYTPTTTTGSPATVSTTSSPSLSDPSGISYTITASSPALAIDGTPPASVTNMGTSGSITLSCPSSNSLICVWVVSTIVSNVISSINSTSGLTWNTRTAKAGGGVGIQMAYAIASGPLTNEVITIQFNQSLTWRLGAFAVTGANTTSPFFDPNASLPASVSGNTTTLGATISTNHANDMIVTCLRGQNALGTITKPSGFTSIVSGGTATEFDYLVVASTQSNVTETYSWTTSGNALLVVDAIQGAT